MITEAISAENAVVSFEDSIGAEDYRQFKNELRQLDLSEVALRVSIYGVTRTRFGITQRLGGHFHYSDFSDKSLYPEHWGETTIVRAVNFVRDNPITARANRNSTSGEVESFSVRGVYDGVIIHIEWEPGKLKYPFHVYPLYGDDVKIRRRDGTLKQVPFVAGEWRSWRLL